MSLTLQSSLFDLAVPSLGELAPARTQLAYGAWVDHLPNWLAGADDVFAELASCVEWHEERRQMYDRVVDVPRLLSWFPEGASLPLPLLADMRDRLSDHYLPELGEPFTTAGLCYYRDGRDSVAWHGDRIGRGRLHDTMVAIVSVGDARKLSLRPAVGPHRSARTFQLGHGDLLVMGGSCQRTWEHAVPKSARAVGPRISIQFRPAGVA